MGASFSAVTAQPLLKKCEANFFKAEKAAPLQVRCPPAAEAKAMKLKEAAILSVF